MRETLTAKLVLLLRRAAAEEASIVARAIGVLAICIGPEQDWWFDLVRAQLSSVATRHDNADVRGRVSGEANVVLVIIFTCCCSVSAPSE
jgi:DNA-binding transcriptional regulator YdaS (Cro superfamily)